MAPFKKSGGFRGGDRPQGGFNRGGERPQFAHKGFSRGNDRGGRDDRAPQMFTATCAECRKSCEVPFRPNGEKPVFCRDCFAAKRGSEGGDRHSNPRDFTPRDYDRPSPSQAPAQHKPAQDSRIDGLVRQVESMTKKLDTLTQMIEGLSLAPTAPVKPAAPAKKEKVAPTLAKVVKKVAKKAAKTK